jgi:formylglycine-generating enzyme required for sulfatase activity
MTKLIFPTICRFTLISLCCLSILATTFASDGHHSKNLAGTNWQLDQSINLIRGELLPDLFVLIKGGCFLMGDQFNDGYSDEKPLHEVCVDNFYLGKYEVTRDQWNRIYHKNHKLPKNKSQLPKSGIGMTAIKKFIQQLNKISKRSYRLPTEAEWEYACREGGKKVRFGNGKNIADPNEISFDGSPGFKKDYSISGIPAHQLRPVGQFQPNALGLFDMSGNAGEWVQDNYSVDAYQLHQKNNPIHISPRQSFVFRSDRSDHDPQGIRCAYRYGAYANYNHQRLGFRLVLIN